MKITPVFIAASILTLKHVSAGVAGDACSWCNPPDLATCGTVSDPYDWTLVRAISGGNWFPNGDHLAGTAGYTDNGASSYNIGNFETFVPGYNQFLFISGNCVDWALSSVDAVNGEHYANQPRNVCGSSASPTAKSTPLWYNRDGSVHDPLVTPVNWDASTNIRLYVEAWTGELGSITSRNGLYVFARNAGTLDAEGCVEPDPCNAANCEADEVCVAGECQRNCEVLDIDSFLTDCSTEYEGVSSDIDALQASQAASNTRLNDIDTEIAGIKLTLDQISAKAPGANFGNFPDESVNNGISTENKDLLIIGLLILNILMVIGGCIFCSFWMKSQAKYGKYAGVRDYESNDEQEKLQN